MQLIKLNIIIKLCKVRLLLQYYFITKKILKENRYSNSKKIQTALLKDIKPDGLPKIINKYKIIAIKKLMHLLHNQIYHKFCWQFQLN